MCTNTYILGSAMLDSQLLEPRLTKSTKTKKSKVGALDKIYQKKGNRGLMRSPDAVEPRLNFSVSSSALLNISFLS